MRFCRENGIAVTAFSPLGAPSYVPLGMADADESVLDEPVVREAAAAARQDAGPGACCAGACSAARPSCRRRPRPERLAENLAVFDFELSADEMRGDRGARTATAGSTTPASSPRPRSTPSARSTSKPYDPVRRESGIRCGRLPPPNRRRTAVGASISIGLTR